MPTGTDSWGGFGTSNSSWLSSCSIGPSVASSSLIRSRIARSSFLARSSAPREAAEPRRCSAFNCSTWVTMSRRCRSSSRMRSTGAGSPLTWAPFRTRSGFSRMKLRLSILRPQVRKENHVPVGMLVRQHGRQPVDPQPHPAGWRKAMLERDQEVLVERMRFLGTLGPRARLVLEAPALVDRVVDLGEGVGDLGAGDEQLEAVRQPRIVRPPAGQRRDLDRMPEHESRLDQARLDQLLEQGVDQAAPAETWVDVDLAAASDVAQAGHVGPAEVLAHRLADGVQHLQAP